MTTSVDVYGISIIARIQDEFCKLQVKTITDRYGKFIFGSMLPKAIWQGSYLKQYTDSNQVQLESGILFGPIGLDEVFLKKVEDF